MADRFATKIFKHTPTKIPFHYESRDKVHIQVGKGTPNEKWLEERGFHRSVNGFCPLNIQETKEFENKFLGKTAYIVGKGPSMDHLTPEHFTLKDSPILAVNEAHIPIKKMRLPNPLYLIQCDAPPRYYVTHEDTIIVPHKVAHHYLEYPNLYILETDRGPMYLSSSHAIKVGFYFGCMEQILVCFDAMLGITGYPPSLLPDLSVKRLADHVMQAGRIKLYLGMLNIKYKLLIPNKERINELIEGVPYVAPK